MWWYAVSIGYIVSCWRALPKSTSVFWLIQSHLWHLSFLLPRCLFFCPGMWCLTYSFPSLLVCAAASLFFAWVVSVLVSVPCVIAGSTHELYTCLFKHVPMFRAYMYVVVEAKMTKIFAVYLQASDFLNQASEYAFECCRKQVGPCGICLSCSSFLQEFDVHIFCQLFSERGQYVLLLEFALSRTRSSRPTNAMQSEILHYHVGNLLLNPACTCGWFSSIVFSSFFFSTFMSTFDNRHISV